MPRRKAIPKRTIFAAVEAVKPSLEILQSPDFFDDPWDSNYSDNSPASGGGPSARRQNKKRKSATSSKEPNCSSPAQKVFNYCSDVAFTLASWTGDGSWSESAQCIITALYEGDRVLVTSAAVDPVACAAVVKGGKGLTEKVFNALRALQQKGILAVRTEPSQSGRVQFQLGLPPAYVAENSVEAEKVAMALPATLRSQLKCVLVWATASVPNPADEDLDFGTEEFLAAVKPPGQQLGETAALVGEDKLACTLLGFQRHTVSWMHRVEARLSSDAVPHPSWQLLDGVYVNPQVPGVSRSAASLVLSSVRGGMLCDEMGLGKTVEVLATVATRPSPLPSLSVEDVLSHFYESCKGALLRLNGKEDSPGGNGSTSRALRREVSDLHATYLLRDGYAASATTSPSKQGHLSSWLEEFHPDKAEAVKEVFGCPESPSVPEEPTESCCLTCGKPGDTETPWVACDVCEGWHHLPCVGYTGSGDFICLTCLHTGHVDCLELRATLIVVPASLLQQWQREIAHHAPSLRVLIFEENADEVYPTIADLAGSDVVLVSYPVLGNCLARTESAEWDKNHALRYRRQSSASSRTPSPLLRVRWWRLVMDEAQMTEGGHSAACRMLQRLVAVNRWAVSGTPITRGDLRSVLDFLGVPLEAAEIKAIQDSHGGARRLLPLMRELLWRVWKVDVLDQLKMRGLVQHVVWQELSAVEMFGYRRLEESIRQEAQASISKRRSSKKATSYLWDLTRLLQLQCVHQDLRMKQKSHYTGRNGSKAALTDVKYSTFEANVKSLISGAVQRAEEALRNLVASWNGQAGLLKLKGDEQGAVQLYQKSLEAEEKFGTRVDKVQKIHALVHSGADDVKVQEETDSFLSDSLAPLTTYAAQYRRLREQLPHESSEWWLVAGPTLGGPMEAAYFQQDLREVDECISHIVEGLEKIPVLSLAEHVVTEHIICAKCNGKGRPGKSCMLCRTLPYFEGYERVAHLPRFVKITHSAPSGSELIKYFRVIQNIMATLKRWRDFVGHRLGAFNELRQHRLAYRWALEGEVAQPKEEIGSWDNGGNLVIWSQEELELKMVELQAEENDAEVKLRRNLGHLRFLKTQLPDNSDDRPGLEICPVCATDRPTTVCMLPCGHSYCQQCIVTLLQRGRGSFRCPECRVFTRHNEIGHIGAESPDTEAPASSPDASDSDHAQSAMRREEFAPLPVQALKAMSETQKLIGEWGTRMSSVTLLVKHITEDLGESVCVFSKWMPVLHLLGSALNKNRVPFVLWSMSKMQTVERFFDGRVRVLLCPLASAGQGLNLTVASHAILIEPPPKYSQTTQAAARIWRLGQEKEATVWHFVSCRTVEEAMWTLSRRSDEEEDAQLLRDIFSGLTGDKTISATGVVNAIGGSRSSVALCFSVRELVRLRGIFSSQRTFLHTPSKSAAQVRGHVLGNLFVDFSKSLDKYRWLEDARGALEDPKAWDLVTDQQLKAFAETLEALTVSAILPAELTPFVATILPHFGNLSAHATRFLSKRASSWTPDVCRSLARWASESSPSPPVRALEPIIKALPLAPASCAEAVTCLIKAVPVMEALKDVVAEYCIVIPTNVKLVNAAIENYFSAEAEVDLLPIALQGAVRHLDSIAKLLGTRTLTSVLNQHFVALRTHRRVLDKVASAATRDVCIVAADTELARELVRVNQEVIDADEPNTAEMHAKLYREITMIFVTCFWREILTEELHATAEGIPLRRLLLCCHILSRRCPPPMAGRTVVELLVDEITIKCSEKGYASASLVDGLPLACALVCDGAPWHRELICWSLSEALPLRLFAADVLLSIGGLNTIFCDNHAKLLAKIGPRASGPTAARLALAFAAVAAGRPSVVSHLFGQSESALTPFFLAVLKLLSDGALAQPCLTSATVSMIKSMPRTESMPLLLALLRPRPCPALRTVAHELLAEDRVRAAMKLGSGLGKNLVFLTAISACVAATGERMLRALLIFAEKKLREGPEFEPGAPWLQLLHILEACDMPQKVDEARPLRAILIQRAGILSELCICSGEVLASCEVPERVRTELAAKWSEATTPFNRPKPDLPSPFKRLKTLLNSEAVDLGRIRATSQHVPAAESNAKALQAEVQDLRSMVKRMAEDAGRFSETVGTLRESLHQQQHLTEQYRHSYQRLSDRLNAMEADLREEVLGRGNLEPLLRYIDDEESPRACLRLLREGCIEAMNNISETEEAAEVNVIADPMQQSKPDDAVVGLQVAIHSRQPHSTTGGRRAVLAELNKATRIERPAKTVDKPSPRQSAHNVRVVRNYNIKDDSVYTGAARN
ncbi:hypothetical protein FOL47_005413 [Perkinsus chesapeaki]|uniref:RING-type domain-containing protein n=1 Tax=Perkinsus chesapeaki TaxID=330153 RepID=A0A7J6N3A7_PERCH|nr:hypothetical protein FOL47_005413 [Perkinsus chesapeaki]